MNLSKSRLRLLIVVGALAAAVPLVSAAHVTHVSAANPPGQYAQPLANLGSGTLTPAAYATSTDPSTNEIDDQAGIDSDATDSPGAGVAVNRSIAKGSGSGASTQPSQKAKSNPELVRSFDGLNFFDQRFANHGNQFSIEPPDQALCVGGGHEVEATNDVLKVFNTDGTIALATTDLNSFYGYSAAINRSTGVRGPSLTDPVCYFDSDTQRFYLAVLTFDTGASGARTGTSHIDLAVSNSSDPTQGWHLFSFHTEDNGTLGQPDHQCNGGFCFGDYPHIGADSNGIYISTNEFALFGPGFYGAQVYAISKRALAAGTATSVVHLDNLDVAGTPGFTLWPAQSPGVYDGAHGGTEYLMSSLAVFQDNGVDNRIAVTALSNTSSLDSASPSLGISTNVVNTEGYGVPGYSAQKAGSTPLADCINSSALCRAKVGAAPIPASLGQLNSNDSRMQQVSYANGKLWGALDTGLIFNNDPSTIVNGIAYFVINPHSSRVDRQGYLGLQGDNLNYPALAVTPSGRGVIAFTLVGNDYYPSAAYAGIDAKIGAGAIHLAAAGAGPQDGFTEYKAFGSTRPRWGDYGAAAVDGNTIWLASEYIGQTCTFAQYSASPFGTCGGTRGSLGNWDTRITAVTP